MILIVYFFNVSSRESNNVKAKEEFEIFKKQEYRIKMNASFFNNSYKKMHIYGVNLKNNMDTCVTLYYFLSEKELVSLFIGDTLIKNKNELSYLFLSKGMILKKTIKSLKPINDYFQHDEILESRKREFNSEKKTLSTTPLPFSYGIINPFDCKN